MRLFFQRSLIFKTYENGVKMCGYKLKVVTSLADVFVKGDGLGLMKNQKAYAFTGWTPRLSTWNEIFMSMKHQHLVLRGRILKDPLKQILIYLTLM